MRIAFVGKGGAGKTSLCVLFSQHLKGSGRNVLVVDADINTHASELLGFGLLPQERHLSHPEATAFIRNHLRGRNARIPSDEAFRKTTPPAEGSNLFFLDDAQNPIAARYAVSDGPLRLMVVGTYHEEDVGATCYHNHLATFENLLTHLVDDQGVLVADMVAGVDAFASTLHAQFDLTVLVVEPTRRSVDVYERYAALAQSAGCLDALRVVGNKVRSPEDAAFVQAHVPADRLLGVLSDSDYLRRQDKERDPLTCSALEPENRLVLDSIETALFHRPFHPQKRLQRLWELHKKYVAQPSICERFGDLSGQIDPDFDFLSAIKRFRGVS